MTDDRHRPGMGFLVEVARLAGMKEDHLQWWWSRIPESTRRKRLHGWRMWQDYCMENGYQPADMRTFTNPVLEVSRFLATLETVGTPIYLVKEALTAVRALLEMADPRILPMLKDSPMIADTIRISTTGLKQVSKYRSIWKLDLLIDYIRDGPPSEELEWTRLMARAAALFMVFIPCRPIGAWRMDPQSEKWSADKSSVEITTKEKMDHGKSGSALLLRASTVPNLCPVHAYRLLKAGAASRGMRDTLWCSAEGVPYRQASALSRLLKALLQEVGVPSHYTAYSIRHALITALFDRGLTEVQVNAYTGHSNNAHTAVTHYFHLDSKWVGSDLEKRVSRKEEEVSERDDEEWQKDLHEGEEDRGEYEAE